MDASRGALCLTLMPNSVSGLLPSSGTELADSRRYLDCGSCSAMSVQFKTTGPLFVTIDGSLDDGATWNNIVPVDTYTGANPYRTGWWPIPDAMRADNLLLRAVAIGTGLVVGVAFVELQYR